MKPRNRGVFKIEVLLPGEEAGEQHKARSVKVLFVVDETTPALALSGQVASSCPSSESRDDGEPLFRLQLDVSVEDAVTQWNTPGAGCSPEAGGAWGPPHYRIGKLIGMHMPPGPAAA